MAEYISFQPSDFYSSLLYSGTGSSNAVTGVGFQPDFCWIKGRNYTYDYGMVDSVRGVQKTISSNDYAAQSTISTGLTAFGADGFTVVSDNIFNGGGGPLYASWNWKAGTTTGLSGGTMTPVGYSINTTSAFGIYQYLGTGAVATIAHGLAKVPKFVMTKSFLGNNWRCYHEAMGNTQRMQLNESTAEGTDANAWDSTTPTDTLFTLGSSADTNNSGDNYIAYMFCDVPGFSKMDSYVGNGNADGAFVYTGFKPAFIMVKCTSHAEPWLLWDNKRAGYNVENYRLNPNQDVVENTSDEIDLLSNGFKFRSSGAHLNGLGRDYMYAAFAEFPTVSSNDIPGVAK